MLQIEVGDTFESWRIAARALLAAGVEPDAIIWTPTGQGRLFRSLTLPPSTGKAVSVPRQFIKLAEAAACFDSEDKWPLLYRILFRLGFENKQLLEIESDADIRDARLMEKAVNRDVHKFHAFVRFRKIEGQSEEIFAAWHEPQHFTVERATPFFTRRFGSMNFSIFTPKGCAHWDKEKLAFSPAAERSAAPDSDEMEDFWLLYYRSIFNPFRLKIKAMKNEFPVRHWPTLPEAALIPELIRKARS